MTDQPTLLEVAEELYALPLAQFTPARDARAKELKGTDLAAEVKALKKPSLAAWVVNIFVRGEAKQVEQVLGLGAALREAQQGMSGDELRALTKQRRQLTAAVTQQARSLARERGVKVTPAVADQVEATLTAAMISEECGEAVRSGLLIVSMSTTGVDDLDLGDFVAVPEALGHVATPRPAEVAPRPDLHVVPDPDASAKARAAAEAALEEAQEALVAAQESYDESVGAVEDLQARLLQIEAEVDELKRKIATLEETYDEVDDDLGEAEQARTEAYEALQEATDERDAAASAVEKLR